MSHYPAYNLSDVRQQFPIAEQLTYLNHASISPLPQVAHAAMQRVVDSLAGDPTAFFKPPTEHDPGIFITFAQTMAKLINAEHLHEITGIQSTSTGLNAVAQAIPWEPGDNLVFCDVEFPSNAYPWMALEQRGIECRIAPALDGGASVAAFEPFVDDRTRVIAASAVQYFTGHRTDLTKLGAFCHARGILFVVDAIQSAGHIPIDVQAMHIDVLASGGQKSLMGSPGQGFLYVRDSAAETMRPRTIGPNSTRDWLHWAKYDLTPERGALRFAMGTPNVSGMAALIASVDFLCGLGIAHIDTWTNHLSQIAIETISARGYTFVTPADPTRFGPIVTFRLGEPDPTDAADVEQANQRAIDLLDHLTQHNVRVTKHWDQNRVPHLRISSHCYNTEADIYHISSLIENWQ